MVACPICSFPQAQPNRVGGHTVVRCERCGVFEIGDRTAGIALEWAAGRHQNRAARGRFAASHAIRRMQGSGNPSPRIDEALLASLWAEPLPNPQRQVELFLLALGGEQLPIDEYVRWRAERFCAEIGSEDDPAEGKTGGLALVMKRLTDIRLVEVDPHPPGATVGTRLTFDGWAEYERLRREVAESRTAFMAMGYSNPTLAKIVAEHFVPAVKETGFELYQLDDRPRPGLIDNRMRVEIRAARFLVCDLTDENRGAYWESGFAEGAGKPVFYICEKTKFSEARTHFDTEHMQTIRWEETDPASAAEELKAAIRNEFPSKSTPPDLSKRKGGGS